MIRGPIEPQPEMVTISTRPKLKKVLKIKWENLIGQLMKGNDSLFFAMKNDFPFLHKNKCHPLLFSQKISTQSKSTLVSTSCKFASISSQVGEQEENKH